MPQFDNQTIKRLIQLSLIHGLTQQEEKILAQRCKKSKTNQLLQDKIKKEWKAEEVRYFLSIDTEQGWQNVKRNTFSKSPHPKIKKRSLLKYTAIALPFVFAISFYLFKEHTNLLKAQLETSSNITQPILTLDDGQQLILNDDAPQNEILIEEETKAYHNKQSLIYKTQNKTKNQQWNHLQIPQGTNYQIILSDGTKIWLNANSKLKYPIAFSKKERRVYLDGEAYFEVAKYQDSPFYVETQGVEIKVLGTHFNVNTHYLEGVRTVLVEGSIALCRQGHKDIALHPGECADFKQISSEITIRPVDTNTYTAWKNGFFAFDAESLEEIVNMLACWYGKEIIFHKPEHRKLHFSGHIKRYDKIDSILCSISELTNITFQCKGNTIFVE